MAMALAQVTLDDKYTLESGRIFLTGIQALVRLPIMQRQRDASAGLNTAGFVSGYRGSPLGALDQTLWKARPFLERNHIHFRPGINEDLAATSVWGTQQVNMFDGARFDGVFGMWYGKGPGVDRSGDVFKHANAAGTSRYGGVLVVAGDDHACKSSTLPHQSEYAFMDAMMPVLNPSGVQEVLDLGLLGWELSRFCGCWIGFKTIAETVDSSASVSVDPQRVRIVTPEDFALPEDGLHARWPDKPLDQEMRLQKYKLYAAVAFARANGINEVVIDSPLPRIGIITTGKSYLDVRQALEDLGIDEALAAQIGLRVLKLGMSWPLDREVVRDFAEGLEEVLIVEEKRAVIENQVKEQLYNWRADVRPRVIGKFDEGDDWTSEEAWIKANPNYGVSVYPLDIKRLCKKAQQMPSEQNAFLTKRLNVWCNADEAWMNMQHWDRCASHDLRIEDFAGQECWLGVDLASKNDIASVAQLFRDTVAGEQHVYAFTRNYLPEAAVRESQNVGHYDGWRRSGHLVVTPGNILDIDVIEGDCAQMAEDYNVIELAFDPLFNATQFGVHMVEHGLLVVEVRPSVLNFSEPMKWMEAYVLDDKWHHTGDPVMTWAVSNIVCHTDAKDNIFPNKPRRAAKIDPVIASLMAFNRLLAAGDGNYYTEHSVWNA